MSLGPSQAQPRPTVLPGPAVAPQALALPGGGLGAGLAHLRAGGRNGLKMAAPASPLTIPAGSA